MIRKCRRIGTPEPQSQIRYTPQPSRMPLHSQPTPMPGVNHTPWVVGPNRCTFKTPEPPSPLTPSATTNLLQSLNLVEMEGGGTPPEGVMSDSWMAGDPDTESVADTDSMMSCSTACLLCFTP